MSTHDDRKVEVIPRDVIVEFPPVGPAWIVRRDGASRATSVHSSQAAAERAARLVGRRRRCDVVVKAADGAVERRYDYEAVPRNRSERGPPTSRRSIANCRCARLRALAVR